MGPVNMQISKANEKLRKNYDLGPADHWHGFDVMFQQMATWNTPIMKLFCRFLFVFLRRGEALRLFATTGALPNVISSVIVPHKAQYSSACRALATRRRMTLGCCSRFAVRRARCPQDDGYKAIHASDLTADLWPLTSARRIRFSPLCNASAIS